MEIKRFLCGEHKFNDKYIIKLNYGPVSIKPCFFQLKIYTFLTFQIIQIKTFLILKLDYNIFKHFLFI